MIRSFLVFAAIAVCCQLTLLAKDDSASGEARERAIETVDRLLEQQWSEQTQVGSGIVPAKPSGDAEFCRRVWMDLAGIAPPVWQLRSFLADDASGKRERLVDSLLQSPRHARHMANRWTQIMLPADMPGDRQGNSEALRIWLREQFQQNKPYDHLVGSFLTAGGKSDSGPAVFYTSRSLEPVKLAAATSRIFMGVQIQCAQCHDDPYDRWKQEDFWSFAAFFAQLRLNDSSMSRGQTIDDRSGGEVMFPETDRVVLPRYPGFETPPEEDPTDFRRRQLTIWLASRDNPYFARAAVNRVWAHLFGRGLVDPVDQMDTTENHEHTELLNFLAAYLVSVKFDLRELYAMLARTQAYHRTSHVGRGESGVDVFARMNVKTLSAEQYFDSLDQNVLRSGATNPGIKNQFLSRMRISDAGPTEYPHGVVQALGMMNGPEMVLATDEQQSGLVGSLMAPLFTDADRIETIFLACLSRLPSEPERTRFDAFFSTAKNDADRRQRMSDMVWVLLNTAECAVCP